jgi:Type II intron maturase/Reverse transcriptase (RNA-dependent DNA polymerase)
MYARYDQTAHRLPCPQDKRWATIVMESCVMRKYPAQFGERDRETRLAQGRKVRSVPTPLSPVLSNIYLDRLDTFVETVLLPTYNRKAKRRKHPLYTRIASRVSKLRRKGRKEEAAPLRKQMLQLPSYDPDDPEYRRLRYVRYADDFLLGFAGPLAEAEEIRAQLKTFLHEELKLELSQEKTLITHAHTGAAHFLGYEIATHHANDKLGAPTWQRTINGKIELRVPAAVTYSAKGKPIHHAELIHESDFAIMEKYQWKYRGLMQYYALAVNIAWLDKLHYVMQTSLLKTLAHKHKSTVNQMVRKYQTDIETPYGKMKCLEVRIERGEKKPLVARFGGIPWRRQETAILHDINPQPVVIPRNELVKRLLQETCELCGSEENISVHHLRGLKDLKGKGRRDKPLWVQVMAAMRRKTLVVCGYCHWAIATGKPTRQPIRGE